MFDRRTRARLVFLAELLAFPFKLSQLRRATDEEGAPIPFEPRWFLTGAVTQTVYIYLYDRDWCAIRTSRWRGVLFVACWLWISHTRLPHGRAVWLNRSLGSSLARMACRLWYGVLRPLPGVDE